MGWRPAYRIDRARWAVGSLMLFVSVLLGCAAPRESPGVFDGQLDLSNWRFEESGVVALEGDWEICWNAALEPGDPCPSGWRPFPVPRLWSDATVASPIGGRGVATYRLRVALPPAHDGLALHVGSPLTAYRLFLDGIDRGGVGHVSTRAEQAVAKLENRQYGIADAGATLDVLVQVANFEFRGGGLRRTWYLGEATQIARRNAYELLLYTAFTTTSLVMGGLFLAQFALRRREASRAWFGLFAMLVGLRIVPGATSDLYQLLMGWASFGALVRLEYVNTALLIAIGVRYISSKIPGVMPPTLSRMIEWSALALVPIHLIAPLDWVLDSLPIVLVLPPLAIVIAISSFARAASRGVDGARPTFLAALVFALGPIHDVIRVQFGVGASIELFPYFVIAWMMLEAHSLLHAYSESYARAERLSEELQEANFELQETEQAVVRFVPFDFLRTLGKTSIRDIRPGDHAEASVTVLACDLHVPEQHLPSSTFVVLNELLARVTTVLQAHGGHSSQQLGDRFVALFPESADEGVAAALGIERAARELAGQAPGAEQSMEMARVSIGIATGRVLVGTVGNSESLSAVVIGPAVSRARRLERHARDFGYGVLVSASTRKAMGEGARYRLDAVEVSGEGEAYRVSAGS